MAGASTLYDPGATSVCHHFYGHLFACFFLVHGRIGMLARNRSKQADLPNLSVPWSHPRQKFNPGALDQFSIADGLRASGGVVIQMPVSPSPVFALVINQLEQECGNMHPSWPNARTLGNIVHKHRTGDDIHVTRGSGCVFSGRVLNGFGPCAPVALGSLRNHVGQ